MSRSADPPASRPRLHAAGAEEILAGRITDVYFERTLEVLRAEGASPTVRAEVSAKTLPDGASWAVLAGVEECLALLASTGAEVRALPEGTLFRALEPVLEIRGEYPAFARMETALLGMLCQASGVATRAARCRLAAGDRPLFSFGARRMHPAVAPVVERSAYVGGCDGVAVVESARRLGLEPVGTMPHALVLVLGGTVEAARAFHEVLPPGIPRVVLIDTFGDEKFETLAAAEALGDDLYAVRLDTPASRRGDLAAILEEVRWELDLRGRGSVKLLVSGGLTEEEIRRLAPHCDGFGVGTYISNAPVVDFSLDIVEVDGRAVAKRGKASGAKDVVRCAACGRRAVVPLARAGESCPCGAAPERLLAPRLRDGRLLGELPAPARLREYVLAQLDDPNGAAQSP